LFAIGADSQVYALPLDPTGSAVPASYTLTSPGQVQSIRTGHTTGNIVFVLAVGLDSQVYAQDFDRMGASISPFFLTVPGTVIDVEIPTSD
jgi:hypothetical protein